MAVVRVLDRVPSLPDPVRVSRFAVAPLIEDLTPRSYTWQCLMWLDQGREGACVGHGWTHEFAARPAVVRFPQIVPDTLFPVDAQRFAFDLYNWCKLHDEWAGENYEGTSVAAGARGAARAGLVPEYRWTQDADELAVAVSRKGPAVLGIDMWTKMMDPDSDGLLHVEGTVEGGHCILANGYNVKRRTFRLHNSWGKGWGRNGEAEIHLNDMRQLMATGGEACLPLTRRTGT